MDRGDSSADAQDAGVAGDSVERRENAWINPDASGLKSGMPDLVPVEAFSQEGQGEAARASGNGIMVAQGVQSTGDESLSIKQAESTIQASSGEGRNTPDPKKKIPVESLGRDELVQQCKKQMVLLQKMKQRYDDLQKSHTGLQSQQGYQLVNGISSEEDGALHEKVLQLESELKMERETNKRTKEQIARLSQHSVAELEIRDYTRTIAQLNGKLTAKDDCLIRSTEQLQIYEKLLTDKSGMISECGTKIGQLERRCAGVESSLTESRKECLDKEREISWLRDDTSTLRDQIASLEGKLGDNASHQSDLVRNYSKMQELVEAKERVIVQKNAEISRLNIDLTQSKSQHEHVVRDFEEYKLRAQALLKQQRDPVENMQKAKEIEELSGRVHEMDLEVVRLKDRNEELEGELKRERKAAEGGKRAVEAERVRWESSLLECEERIRAVQGAQEVAQQDHRRKIKSYESDMAALRDLHGSTNEKLLEELRTLRRENETLSASASAHNSSFDHSEKLSPSSNGQVFMRSKSEEFDYPRASEANSSGSGSETSELPSLNRTISVSASEVPSSVPPLEKLITLPLTSSKDVDFKRIKHLSELLHESESTNVRLNEQIRVLKHELRRIESNVEREKHSDNMEYLKNVLMKFLTHRVAQSEQEKLVEVMTTILKLTVEERQQLTKAASVSYIPENVRAWGTYFNPWKTKDG